MIFQPDLAELVITGRKTVTRRLCSENERSPWFRDRCAHKPGESYAVQPGRGKTAICRVTVIAVERMVLGRLSDAEAQLEGFPDRHAFAEAWEKINGSYDETALVWRVRFARPVASRPRRRAVPSRHGSGNGR